MTKLAVVGRAAAALLALACAAAAVALAINHPLSPSFALGFGAVLAAWAAWRPQHAALLPVALLPWAGLMPWTGWLMVEEFDLVLLAVAAGAWAGHAGRLAPASESPATTQATTHGGGLHAVSLLLWLPLVLSTAASAWIGLADAGGLRWGWWQGYREPLNSLRLAKPLVGIALLWPFIAQVVKTDPSRAARRLDLAFVVLLAGVGGVVLRERVVYAGLLDFSSDYRATGPFWEMHVGGAGLDAALAMALPFAFSTLVLARHWPRRVLGVCVLLLGSYAALVTFSRVVYAAVPLGLACWAMLHWRAGQRLAWRPALPWLVGFGMLAAWMFPTSGYRGLLALLAASAVLLVLPGRLHGAASRRTGLTVGWTVAWLALVASLWAALPKGAYIGFAVAFAVACGLLMTLARTPNTTAPAWLGSASMGAFAGLLAALIAVAWHWGGAVALPAAGTAALVLGAAGCWSVQGARTAWPDNVRWQAGTAAVLVAVGSGVAVFGGGAYMGDRLASAVDDSQARSVHWSRALALLRGNELWWGKGLGRYHAHQSLSGAVDDQTGDYALLEPGTVAGAEGAVLLTSGRHVLGHGELFRLSQRTAEPASEQLTLQIRMHNDAAVYLKAEVCEKHLLYPVRCATLERGLAAATPDPARSPGGPGAGGAPAKAGVPWQTHEFKLVYRVPPAPWWRRPEHVFSVSLGDPLNRVVIDRIRLSDASGRELLANTGFEQGLARWYVSSDRHHMPWHAKSLALHLVFEQGLLGLAAFGLVVLAALWRLTLGRVRRHPAAPALAAALLSLLAVGLVDSVLDMPRLAWLTLFVMAAALALPQPAQGVRRGAGLKLGGSPVQDALPC